MNVRHGLLLGGAVVLAALLPSAALAAPPHDGPEVDVLVRGLEAGSGSVIGPDGALYVTEAVAGRLSRVDLETGEVTTVASGLPTRIAPTGGAMDVAFLGRTPYVLVTMVGADLGGADTVGVYRVDGPETFTVVADLGAFALANPPATDFFVPTGVHYAIQSFRGGFLVTDGHHNRVLQVTRDGDVSEFATFGNVVPTGLDVRGSTVYLAQAGPVPHRPQDGTVLAVRPRTSETRVVASGRPLLVDVELGRAHALFALSQGDWVDGPEGSPAQPGTGQLVRTTRDGELDVVATGLDRPTSLEVVGDTAYVVTLDGEVWAVDGLDDRHRHR